MNRVRILFCIDNLKPDGAQRQLVDLVKNMDKTVYDVTVCGIRGGPLQKEIETLGVPVDIIGKKGWWEFPWIALRLFEYVKSNKPVILQSSLFYTNFIASVVGNLLRVPIIATIQHTFYEHALPAWMQPLALITAELSDVTVTVFEKKSHLNRGACRIVSIPNGVDISRFDIETDRLRLRAGYGVNRNDIIILTAGRLSSKKGQEYLVRAISILRKSYPQIRLMVAGDGDLREALEQLTSDLDLSSNVTFLGRRNDMPFLYQLSDIFVLPSIYEGFGLVAGEAMASRTPVIATQAVSVTNLIRDNETAFLVPTRDAEAIAKKVKWVLEHPEVAGDVAEAAFRRVKSLFSSQLMAQRYMELYQGLLLKKNMRSLSHQ